MSPLVSVVVPTYRRPRQLARCLEALSAQTLARSEYEVIVVDDGSPDELEAVVEPYRSRLSLRLIRHVPNEGPAATRNRGIRAAAGEIIALTDDDCEPRPEWLERLGAALSAAVGPSMVGGRVVNLLPENVYSEASQVILEIVYDYFNPDPADAYFFASMNIGLRRAELLDCGGFDATFRTAEDRELCSRWRARGHRLVYEPGVVIGHAHDLSLRSFCRQHFAYGRGAYRYHRMSREGGSGSMRAESRFQWALPRLVRKHLRGRGVGRALSLLALLGLWQVFNAAGYLTAGRRLRAAHASAANRAG